MSSCGYQHSGWVCESGQLRPESVATVALNQPCPACATAVFLDLARARAGRLNASCGCVSCLPKLGLGTSAFQMALDEAIRVNPDRTRHWLSEHEHPAEQTTRA